MCAPGNCFSEVGMSEVCFVQIAGLGLRSLSASKNAGEVIKT